MQQTRWVGCKGPPCWRCQNGPQPFFPAERETGPVVACVALPYAVTHCRVPSGRATYLQSTGSQGRAGGGDAVWGRACLALTPVLELPSRTERQLLQKNTL
jgi:hypothetical protein